MKLIVLSAAVVAVLAVAAPASAHTLLIACHDETATVTCKVSYSDGEAARAAKVRVVTEQDKVLKAGVADAQGAYSFAKPVVAYHVVAQTGPHHVTNLSSVDVK